ncbi:MAG: L,D-transpeptidase [Acidimicrobiia bacterium]|nr:L,D-transpeptidase [Acidimicrobiia bacterium]
MNQFGMRAVMLLRDSIATRLQAPLEIGYESVDTKYLLHLEIGRGRSTHNVRIVCPRTHTLGPVSQLRGIAVGGPSPEIVPVPGEFLSGSGDRLFTSQTDEITSHVDLVALLNWATGGSASTLNHAPDNWSSVAMDTDKGWMTSYAFVDVIVDDLVSTIGYPGQLVPDRLRDPWLLVTGDTDDASEGQILEYLEFMGEHKVPTVLLFRSGEQLSPRVCRAMEAFHYAGVHPYSDSGNTADFLENLTRLSDIASDATGQAPWACRHHRFQWHEPRTIHQALIERGVRADFNLVAASGRSWIGTPTGIGRPLSVRDGDGTRPPLWMIPTVLEDDVFLFDEGYGYVHSGDAYVNQPRRFLREFLDHWQLFRGLPMCVNLHPEHIVDSLRWVMDTVVDWIEDHPGSARSLSSILGDFDGTVAS